MLKLSWSVITTGGEGSAVGHFPLKRGKHWLQTLENPLELYKDKLIVSNFLMGSFRGPVSYGIYYMNYSLFSLFLFAQ